jgi:putative DNA primase/helicase
MSYKHNLPTTAMARIEARKFAEKQLANGYKEEAFYTYTSDKGVPIYWRMRLDHPTKDKWIRPLSLNGSKWELKEPNFPNGKPLYRLHEIAERTEETVWVVEGEKCADLLADLGLTVTTSGSSTSAGSVDWSPLSSRNIIIWRDNDEAGLGYAKEVTEKLLAFDCCVKWVDISKLGWSDGAVGSDGVDWIFLNPKSTKDDIEALTAKDPEISVSSPSKQQIRGARSSQVLEQITSDCELFHSDDSKCYATVPINSHKETWSLGSTGFRNWLARGYYEVDKSIPKSQALTDLIDTLKARARYEGVEQEVFIRVAEKDESIFLDLGNDKWGVVEITSEGWQVISNPPVKFIRPNTLLNLPIPEREGTIKELRMFLNVQDDDLILVIGFLLFCLNPSGPFPIMIVQGEQGSAKSTFGRVIRSLIDPSIAMLRSAPKNEKDLMIAAQNGWLLSFDNLSSIKQEMSDSLCRLATGGGFSTRQLYTDGEEIIFEATRPISLNGITEFATRDDLLDRALIIKLPSIPPEKRMEEKAFWAEFEKVRPKILGALLDLVSAVLKNRPDVKLADPPRMADFAKFVTAAEPALGFADGAFMEAYTRNRELGREIVLESDSVAQAVLSWNPNSWFGTATDLLGELEGHTPKNVVRSPYWPKSASALSGKLNRLLPALREKGFDIRSTTNGKGNAKRRIIRVNRVEESSTDSSDPTDSDEGCPF